MPETNKEYCEHGGVHCPYCGSEDIDGGFIQIHTSSSTQVVICNECGKQWTDVYTLTGYEPVE